MGRRVPLAVALALSFGACATLDKAPAPRAPGAAAKPSADRLYASGETYRILGQPERARREWDRCLAAARPEEPARLDCLVALEKLSAPGTLDP